MATATQTPNATPTAPAATNTEQELFKQSFSFRIPKNEEGIKEIFKNEDGTTNFKALVYVVRAGLKQVINNRVRQEFTAKDDNGNPAFVVKEGIYDATPLVLNAPQRAVLSQRDKLEKNLKASNLPQAVIDTMLSTYDVNVGTAPEEGGNTAIDTNEARVVLGGKEGKQLIMKVGASSDEDEE